MKHETPEPQVKNKPKFRIGFYRFLLIVALLIAVLVATIIKLQGELHNFKNTKQAGRASIAEVQAESQAIDTVWRSVQTNSLLSYSSPEQECIRKDNGQETSICLPDVIYGKLQVMSHEPGLVAADKLVSLLNSSGWKQQNYGVKVDDKTIKPRHDVSQLPATFQYVHLYYVSPQQNQAKRCIALIYSSQDAQTPGWNGHIGKCSQPTTQ